MQKYLLLHWRGWDENQNWFPWLKKELSDKWIETIVPNLPNTTIPEYEEQFKYIKKYKDELKEWDVIIWHSLGCKLAMHFIEEYKLKWLKVILVAPVYPWIAEDLWKNVFWEAYDGISKYFNKDVKFEKLWNRYIIFLSNNDFYIDKNKAKKYLDNLENVEFVEFNNMWHFNEWAWVYELKELLEY